MVETNEMKSGAELLIDALQKNGLNNMYGVVGIPVTDFARLAQRKGMKFFGFRREDAAVNAAAIEGYLTQKPGLALTVSAPGFLNGLAALAQATKNCFPLIMISGSSERHIIDLDQGDYEGLDQYNIAKPFCKKAYRVDRAEDMAVAVARAIRAAVSGRPGGVYLDLPAATIGQVIKVEDVKPSIYQLVDPAPAQLPSLKAIDRAVDIIKRAKKPLLILGKGAAYAQTESQLQALVKATGLPFLPMSMAKGLIPDSEEHSVAAARSLALKEADVVILVGARLNWMLAHGAAPIFNADVKFIQLDISAEEFDSNQPIVAPIQGDLVSALELLLNSLQAIKFQVDPAWLAELAAHKAENIEKMAKRISAAKASDKFGFYGAMAPIKEYFHAHPETYLVSEGANTLDIGRNVIDMQLPRHRLDTGTWGVMGVGLGYAIGAAVATGKPVVALEGDSGFGFDAMEMETICRYNLPVTVVVVNNGGIYNGTDREVSNQPGPTMLDANAHYEKIASAFGGDSYFVTNYKEMANAFHQAVTSGRPSIINAAIDPSMGKESGHIQNLNPKLDLTK